jgi:hypothetical protein
MADPVILSSYSGGHHNANLDATISRLDREGAYKDLRTVIIIPALQKVDTKAVASWWSMITPPNQGVVRLFAQNMEVGAAYSATIESVLAHPDLKDWPYILTMEADNVVPPDGLLKLLALMEEHQEYACIGGAYFTKGHSGVFQAWGNPNEHPINFKPQLPRADGGLVPCVGTGMGFNLWRTKMFKDQRLPRPLFKTKASVTEGVGTQDLSFWSEAFKLGYKAAISCDVKVGHVDSSTGFVW